MQLKKAHLFYTSLFAVLSVFASAQPQIVDGVTAIVGGDVILKSDIEEQYDVFNRQNFGKPVTYCEVFEELLFQKLLIHHAAIDSISVGEEEVESNMDRRIEQLIMQMGDQKKLEDFYEKSVVEIKEDMRTLIKDQLTAQRMQMTVVEGIEVTPSCEYATVFGKLKIGPNRHGTFRSHKNELLLRHGTRHCNKFRD